MANGRKDVTALRDVNEDLKAAKRILDGDVSGLDVVKALDSTGFTEAAEALLNMLKQRSPGIISTPPPYWTGIFTFTAASTAPTPIRGRGRAIGWTARPGKRSRIFPRCSTARVCKEGGPCRWMNN